MTHQDIPLRSIPNYPDFLRQLNQLPLREYQKIIESNGLFDHFKDELYVEGEILMEYLEGIPWDECPLCKTNPVYEPGTTIAIDVLLVEPCNIHRKKIIGE